MKTEMTLEEQIAAIRKLSHMTGGLHELQIQQLKMYPLIAHDIKSARIEINSELHKIEYQCKSEVKNWKRKKRELEFIYKCTRDVTWDDAVVVFSVNSKKVFEMTSQSWSDFVEKTETKK